MGQEKRGGSSKNQEMREKEGVTNINRHSSWRLYIFFWPYRVYR